MNASLPTITVTLNDQAYIGVEVFISTYMDIAGGIAIALRTNDGEPLAVATANLAPQGHELGPCCVWIKDYAENDGMLQSLEKAGVLERTGREELSGWSLFQEARLLGIWAEAATAAYHERVGEHAKTIASIDEETKPGLELVTTLEVTHDDPEPVAPCTSDEYLATSDDALVAAYEDWAHEHNEWEDRQR